MTNAEKCETVGHLARANAGSERRAQAALEQARVLTAGDELTAQGANARVCDGTIMFG